MIGVTVKSRVRSENWCFKRQMTSVPQTQCGAFEVIQSLGSFRKARPSTQYKLVLSQISKNKQHSGD